MFYGNGNFMSVVGHHRQVMSQHSWSWITTLVEETSHSHDCNILLVDRAPDFVL